MSELMISRADLIEIATEALESAKGITNEQRVEMCETAHTTKEILAGRWLTKDCGCLVGATYREKLKSKATYREKLKSKDSATSVDATSVEKILGVGMMALGLDFDRKLKRKIGLMDPGPHAVHVIDENVA